VFGIYNLTDLASTVTVTIGAAGSGSTSSSVAGGNGGITSFGTVIKAFGGSGGTSTDVNGAGVFAPNVIDSALGSDIIAAGAGFVTNYIATSAPFNQTANQVLVGNPAVSSRATGGNGRDLVGGQQKNIFGSGGAGGSGNAAGSAGTGYGAGGGGAGGNAGAGAPGYCKVTVW
jgi:hypothetical protein